MATTMRQGGHHADMPHMLYPEEFCTDENELRYSQSYSKPLLGKQVQPTTQELGEGLVDIVAKCWKAIEIKTESSQLHVKVCHSCSTLMKILQFCSAKFVKQQTIWQR